MIDKFILQFKETVNKACARYASKNGLGPDSVQLVIKIDPVTDEVLYKYYNNYRYDVDTTFKEILNVRVDFTGKSIIVPDIIKRIMKQCADEYKTSLDTLYVLLVPEGSKDTAMWLYQMDADTNAAKPLQNLNLEEFF